MTTGADDHLDMCVVGGGVAGTYVAHELAVARPEWRIALLERSERVGGRLLSLVLSGAEGLPAELGGMRFRTSQPHVTRVVRALDLPLRPLRTARRHLRLRGRPHGGGRALRAVTDLPLSKTYYFDRLAPDIRPSPPLLLASCSDGPAREHWTRLGGGRRAPQRAAPDPSARWRAYAASEQPGARGAAPARAAARPRRRPRSRGVGVHRLGQRGRGVAEPLPGMPLHVCGEACSASQGRVEGALETAEDVVRRICRERRGA